MPEVEFRGRGWDIAHKGGGERLTRDNIVVNLSDHAYVDPTGKTQRLVCGCKPVAAEKHKCRRCTCSSLGKECHRLWCGCQGRCVSPAQDRSELPSENSASQGVPASGLPRQDLRIEGVPADGSSAHGLPPSEGSLTERSFTAASSIEGLLAGALGIEEGDGSESEDRSSARASELGDAGSECESECAYSLSSGSGCDSDGGRGREGSIFEDAGFIRVMEWRRCSS